MQSKKMNIAAASLLIGVSFLTSVSAATDPLIVLTEKDITLEADPNYDPDALVNIRVESAFVNDAGVTSWPNHGTLGGNFVSDNGFDTVAPITRANISGIKAVQFNGSKMLLSSTASSADRIMAPSSITGVGCTFSVVANIYAPGNGLYDPWEQMFLAWSRRGGPDNTCASFGYGKGWWGAIGGWGPGDMNYGARYPGTDRSVAPLWGQWNTVVMTYDGATAKVYYNGDEVNSQGKAYAFHANMPISLGSQYWGDTGFGRDLAFNGSLAGLKIYSKVLSAEDVLALNPTRYTITSSAGTGGTISPSPSASIQAGTICTFTIKPAFAKQILDVKVDDISVKSLLVPVTGGSSYTFDAVFAPHTIEASFEDVPATANRYEAEDAVLNRMNIANDANASNGKRTEQNGWGGDNVPSMTFTVNVTTQGVYEMAMGYRQPWDGNRDTYLRVNRAALGTIAAPQVAVPAYGRTLKDIALMAGDNTIVLYNNVSWGPHWDYIELPFDAKGVAWKIAASVDGDGGTISPAGNVAVAAGSGQTFTITPDYGYAIADVLVGGASVGTGSSQTVTPTADTTIVASFEIIPPTAPLIANEAPQGVAVSYALACGYLVATNYASTTVKLYYGSSDGGTDANNWDTEVDLGVRSQGEIMHLITGITGPVYYRFYAVNSAGTTWCDVATLITPAAPFNTAGYIKSLTLTCSGYSGTETLLNFPVLVKLNTGITGFSYGDFRSGNNDIRFTTADGSELTYEIDTWNTEGVSLIWVKVPALQAGAQIVMYYSKTGDAATAYTTDGSTWSGGYVGVWHMANTLSRNATGNSAYDINSSWGTPTAAAGMIGNCQSLPGNGGFNAGDVDLPTTFSLSLWSYQNNNQGDRWNIQKGNSNYSLMNRYGWWEFNLNFWNYTAYGNWAGTPSTQSAWEYIVGTYDGSALRLYKNGELVSTLSPKTGMTQNDAQMQIGASFDGKIDEVRAQSAARSSDWIKAEYDNQSTSGSFITYGNVKTGGGTILMIQ